ncbi:hypothetical protein WL91_20180 [Burkholderia multivorans]|nr:hypothetical protein WL91_20180 [Burkholderia multivorans]
MLGAEKRVLSGAESAEATMTGNGPAPRGCGAVMYDEGNGGERTAAQAAVIRRAGARSASRLASPLGEPIYSSAAGRASIITRRRKWQNADSGCDVAQ